MCNIREDNIFFLINTLLRGESSKKGCQSPNTPQMILVICVHLHDYLFVHLLFDLLFDLLCNHPYDYRRAYEALRHYDHPLGDVAHQNACLYQACVVVDSSGDGDGNSRHDALHDVAYEDDGNNH